MVQGRQRSRLTLEPRQSIGVVRKRARQDFDRDSSIQTGIARFVDFAHAASADLRGD